jgi:hemerythrin-like domain-containing protein
LREFFSRAHELSSAELSAFARGLSSHIRKEERQLFERMQALMDTDALAALGLQLEDALKDAAQACALPTAAGKLPAKADSSSLRSSE